MMRINPCFGGHIDIRGIIGVINNTSYCASCALREIVELQIDLKHQCEANARLQKKVRPWWRRWL